MTFDPHKVYGIESPPMLGFEWAADLRSRVPERPDWLVEDYLAAGATTLLTGKPKAGKSTLAWALAEAVASGTSTFVGRPVEAPGGTVVYVSEEGRGTLRHKLPTGPVRVLDREAAWPKPAWPDLIAAGVHEARRHDARLVVIDSLAFWAAFGEGAEKDAGAAQAAMNELGAATNAGLAVLLVHHARKAGGVDGDAVRGSSALFGAADCLAELERMDGAPPGWRRLVMSARWEAPPVLVVERDVATGAWRAVGEAADREEAGDLSSRARVSAALPEHEPGVTEGELVELVGLDKRKVSGPLRELVVEGLVVRHGEGKRGAPFRYFAPRSDPPPKSCPDKLPPLGAETGRNGNRVVFEFLPLPEGGQKRKTEPAEKLPPGEGARGQKRNGSVAEWSPEEAEAFAAKVFATFPGSSEENVDAAGSNGASATWRARPHPELTPIAEQAADPRERARLWQQHGVKWVRTPPETAAGDSDLAAWKRQCDEWDGRHRFDPERGAFLCRARLADGRPCRSQRRAGSPYCRRHERGPA